MKLCKRQPRVIRRHQPCFDFVREIRGEVERGGNTKEDMREGNLLSNLTVENEDRAEKENTKNMRKYLSVPSLKKITKFSNRMRRSTSHMIHNSRPTSLFDKSTIAEKYSSHTTSPPDLLLKMPLIPFWRTSLDLLEENTTEDTTMRDGTVCCARKAEKKIHLKCEDNYMTMRNRDYDQAFGIYVSQ